VINWRVKTEITVITLEMTDREANDLYNELYTIQRDHTGVIEERPVLHDVWGALGSAGVDGTRGTTV
jgi:hypothetical protein